ncbi:FecR domain-containing protein [Marinobacter sp. NSM]|uniref:FecR domain-containing protein n=1 Tax=Marinobacter sp. NSM TaxID=3458004 RepID=UPI0040369E55
MAEAAEWFAWLESEDCTDADRARWRAWLDRAPSHRKAWHLIEQIDEDFRLASRGPAREALSAAGQSRRTALKALMGIGVAVPAAWLASQSDLARTWNSDLQTATGEIREVTLEDGTRLWLDTASAVRLDFNDVRRIIVLLVGAIHVHTAPDSRPLQVAVDQATIQPIGTRFSVSRHDQPFTVAVEEGVVEVSDLTGGRVRVLSGEKAMLDPVSTRVSEARGSDFAWVSGRLVADNLPLGHLADRLNRYYPGMIVATPAAAELRVVGAFPLDRIDQSLDALSDSLPVVVRRVTPWFVLIST